jgi:hypothetical protein
MTSRGSSGSPKSTITRATSVYTPGSGSGISRTGSTGISAAAGSQNRQGERVTQLQTEVTVQRKVSPRLAETAAKYLKNASASGDKIMPSERPTVRAGRAQTVSYGGKVPLDELEDEHYAPTRGPKRTVALVPLDFDELMSVFSAALSTDPASVINIRGSKRRSLHRSSSTNPSKRSSSKRSSSKRNLATAESPSESGGDSPRKSRSRSNSISLLVSSSPEELLATNPQDSGDAAASKKLRGLSKRSSEKRKKITSSQSVAMIEPASARDDITDVLSLVRPSTSASSLNIEEEKPPKRSRRDSFSGESSKRSKTDTSDTSEKHHHHHHHKSRRRSTTIAESPQFTPSPSGSSESPPSSANSSPKKRSSKLKILAASSTDSLSVKDLTSSEDSISAPPTPKPEPVPEELAQPEMPPAPVHGLVEDTPDTPFSSKKSPQVRSRIQPLVFDVAHSLVAAPNGHHDQGRDDSSSGSSSD